MIQGVTKRSIAYWDSLRRYRWNWKNWKITTKDSIFSAVMTPRRCSGQPIPAQKQGRITVMNIFLTALKRSDYDPNKLL
jgi:hypothetical protein